MARPTLLSDELRERIEAELADGIPVAVVAQSAHVGRSTLHDWIASAPTRRGRSAARAKALTQPNGEPARRVAGLS